ncbi:MAG: hypothetical protein LC135_09460 [Phycisphaerae bacterium]|nr:hypothetical protein [Phycisphaerae bacterium]MCZ2400077.1 hypothetical protein [Phycisphaerae bacterium]
MQDDITTSARPEHARVRLRVYDVPDIVQIVNDSSNTPEFESEVMRRLGASPRPAPQDLLEPRSVGSIVPVLAPVGRPVGRAITDAASATTKAAAAALPVSKGQAKLLRRLKGTMSPPEQGERTPPAASAPREQRKAVLSWLGVTSSTPDSFRIVAYDDGTQTALFAGRADEQSGDLTLEASMLPGQSAFKQLPERIVIPSHGIDRNNRDSEVEGPSAIQLSEDEQRILEAKVTLLALARHALHGPFTSADGTTASLPHRPARTTDRTV